LKLNCLIFSTSLNSSLIIFIWPYTVNYRNALDRLRARMNIILFTNFTSFITHWIEVKLKCVPRMAAQFLLEA